MTSAVRQPTQTGGDGFDSKRVSPSRVNALVSCGVAFKLKYLDKMEPQASGSAALKGSVIHLALERWATDRSQDLLPLMRQAWLDFCAEAQGGKTLLAFIEEYQSLSTQAIRLEHQIREEWASRGKESKAPRMTAEWKKSPISKQINALMSRYHDVLNENCYYRFSEFDPLPRLYDDSLVLAKRYENRWKHLPNSIHTELEFNEPWRGFTLNGFIDSIEVLIDRHTQELIGVGVIDYKTYGKPPAEFKDWRQVVMYDAAIRSLVDRGALQLPLDLASTELLVGVDYVNWMPSWKDDDGNDFPPRRFWRVGPADYDRLERELTAYSNTVESGNFLPAEKGRNVNFCDYPENCCLRNVTAAGGESTPVEVNQ